MPPQTGFETDWASKVWEVLCSRMYHQGSAYPASRAAVPLLVEITRTWRAVAVDPALFLAASILSEIDDTGSGAADPRLVDLATHKLSLVDERIDVLYALQCVDGLEGLTAWFEPLAGLTGEGIEVNCRACGDHVFVEVPDDGMFSTELPDDIRGQPVTPATDDNLGPGAACPLTLARDHDHGTVAAQLLTLFGRVACPVCGALFHIGD